MCVACYLKTPTVHKVLSLIEDGHTIPCFVQFTIAKSTEVQTLGVMAAVYAL